jgi:hypothetical protein
VFQALRALERPLVATDPPGPAVLGDRPMHPGGVLWWAGQPPAGLRDTLDLEGEPPSPWLDLLRKLRAARRKAL